MTILENILHFVCDSLMDAFRCIDATPFRVFGFGWHSLADEGSVADDVFVSPERSSCLARPP
jgi:hypothetical protein